MNTHPFSKHPFLWPLGRGGMINPQRVVAVGLWSSAPIRRVARQARSEGRLIDLTYGQSAKWVLFLDSGHIVLAADPIPSMAVNESDSSF